MVPAGAKRSDSAALHLLVRPATRVRHSLPANVVHPPPFDPDIDEVGQCPRRRRAKDILGGSPSRGRAEAVVALDVIATGTRALGPFSSQTGTSRMPDKKPTGSEHLDSAVAR